MMMNPLLDIDKTFSLVIQQEHELLGSHFDSILENNFESAIAMQVNFSLVKKYCIYFRDK